MLGLPHSTMTAREKVISVFFFTNFIIRKFKSFNQRSHKHYHLKSSSFTYLFIYYAELLCKNENYECQNETLETRQQNFIQAAMEYLTKDVKIKSLKGTKLVIFFTNKVNVLY